MQTKYVAEALGTFALSAAVLAAIANGAPLVVPAVAALTLGLFVYTIGSVSGCHINPAVTLGLWSVKKIENQEAVLYIIAQLLGAFGAIMFANLFMIESGTSAGPFDLRVFIAEAVGTFFFVFGIAAVVYGKVRDDVSGLVIGGSLLLGISIAAVYGAAGILNPAVALALNSLSVVYVLAPIVGSMAAFRTYAYLTGKR
jgi:glycerol uptake facilitator-like aquaporin